MKKSLFLTVVAHATAWTPAAGIDGIYSELWLKSDAGLYQDAEKTVPATANADPVYVWSDQSGNGRDASAASDLARPTLATGARNGKPAIRFDGVNNLLTTTEFLDASYASALSCFAVVLSNPSTFHVYASNGLGKFYVVRTANVVRYRHSDFVAKENANIIITKTAGFAEAVEGETYDGSARRIWQNNNYREYAQTTNLALSGALTIGAYDDGSYKNDWDICELLIYKAGLTAAQVAKINLYLSSRWNIPLCTRRLYFEGDSLTSGLYATAGNDYPSVVWRSLGSLSHDYVWNLGVSGSYIADIVDRAALSLAYGVTVGASNILVVWIGTNDISGGMTGADLYTAYASYCSARKAEGYTVICCTLLPRGNGSNEDDRAAFNAAVVTNYETIGTALADIGASPIIGESGDQDNLTYYNADKTHLTDAGYAVVAAIVTSTISAL